MKKYSTYIYYAKHLPTYKDSIAYICRTKIIYIYILDIRNDTCPRKYLVSFSPIIC